MDAAPVLKRKGEEAPEAWLLGGVPVPATKIRRLDAEVPPVGSGAGVLPQPQHAFGVEAARMSGHVGAPAIDATPLLKRKGEEAPWFDVDGVPVPATKIRRLDADVPPVEAAVGVPLVEPGVSVTPQPFVVGDLRMSGNVEPPAAAIGVAAPAVNEERAIVVYQPAEAARNLLHGPLRPGASLRVSPDWIHGLKSTMLQEASNYRALFEEMAAGDDNLSLAMVPWAPAKAHAQAASSSTSAADEMMDADQDGDGASMEVEHGVEGQTAPPAGGALQGEAFHHNYHQQQQQHQWPAQHCVASPQLQLPASSYQPSPVTWSW
ncbi:unnamed protein product [Miscanthus lutarioriparius]|uniref:Uncharacterized protein n=1 Tax=Miscanthus lutarioriparius TaxID=422564 RepID=A0A811NI91_9POAL|nr:unnamed protein product [Miscanthus lutarioriparius]